MSLILLFKKIKVKALASIIKKLTIFKYIKVINRKLLSILNIGTLSTMLCLLG